MLPFLLTALLLATPDEPPAARPVPELPRSPKVDGVLGDFRGGVPLTARPLEGASATAIARVGSFRDTLYIAVEVQDQAVTDRDRLTLALHFPEAGVTAGGMVLRFGPAGKLEPRPEDGVSPATLAMVDAAVHRGKKGMSLEVAVPARALPRFPARDALVLELCLSYEDVDDDGPGAKEISTCATGAPQPELLALSQVFRQGLRPRPPPEVQTVEGRPGGWVGFNGQVDPKWVLGDRPLNEQSLRVLVTDTPVDPAAVRVYVPSRMRLPDGKELLAVLTGQDPFGQDETCAPEREMRLAVFWVKGRVGERVLDWPAMSCSLGRALSVSLDEDGELSVGYSSGATVRFTWDRDHFERIEYGRL
ncbi:MAG: hypothetical protein ACXWLI_09645 [Myxococcaceae bacterium]